jgi:hypothetical protein
MPPLAWCKLQRLIQHACVFQFVSHGMCQAVLREEFDGNWNETWKLTDFFWLTILFIPSLIHEMFWKSGDLIPFIRFFHDIASYLVFLSVLMYSVWNSCNLRNNRTDLEDLAVEIYIFLYVLSITKKVIMILWRKMFYVFYHEMWTIAEILMVICFLTAFCAHAAAAVIARRKGMSDLSRKQLDQMAKSVRSLEVNGIIGKTRYVDA